MDSAQEKQQWEHARDYGIQLLWEQRYEEAIVAFQPALAGDQTGKSHAGVGLAHFQLQRFEHAERHYQEALELEPTSGEWQDMLRRAHMNAVSEISVRIPEVYYFQKDALLSPLCDLPEKLPAGSSPRHVLWLERQRRRIGELLGSGVTHIVNLATLATGTFRGYRDRVWTNWYQRSHFSGVLTLAYMRERLNKHNLMTTYPPRALVGFQAPNQPPPPGVIHFRTANGSWNNLANPAEGAAGTRFLRNVTVGSIDPNSELMKPNPREISRHLLTRLDRKVQEVPFLNLLAAAWIQFENHDWINHGEILVDDEITIPMEEDDPFQQMYCQGSLRIGRTQPDPTWRPGEEVVPIAFINEVTHWWDGSQIYGSDYATQLHLRSKVDGKLRTDSDGHLPRDANGVEETGFRRNWWVGLALLHTLFMREHNSICDRLKVSYPSWNDDRLFNVARMINAAVMAKIHTVEWTPAILPNPVLNAALNANWFGLLTNLCEHGKDRETLSEIKIRNPEMGGVVGNPIEKHGTPYGLSEEFTEVYRLHSLLPETLQLKTIGSESPSEVPVPETRQAGSAKLVKKYGIASLLYSFGTQHPGALVLNNFPRFMQEMTLTGISIIDLGAIDILRARERGVPRYNEFRRQLGLNPITSFDDLTDDKDKVQKLRAVYGANPDKIEMLDLMIGTLAEGHRPTSFGFGETMFQIFILNATRRLQADRFYTDNYNEATYTREGLQWIDSSSVKTVLLRNYPELAVTGLANVTNAFEPWDTSSLLEQPRHPLRAYDSDLQPNPWVGDAFR